MKYIDADLLRKEIEFAKSIYNNPKRVVHGVADAFRQDGRAAIIDAVGTPENPGVNEDAIDWLNSHHFDYRGLIGKGLAIEAPEDMYKND